MGLLVAETLTSEVCALPCRLPPMVLSLGSTIALLMVGGMNGASCLHQPYDAVPEILLRSGRLSAPVTMAVWARLLAASAVRPRDDPVVAASVASRLLSAVTDE